MKTDQSVQTPVENLNNRQKKDVLKQSSPDDGGSQVLFKILISIIGLGVLGLILKSMGIF